MFSVAFTLLALNVYTNGDFTTSPLFFDVAFSANRYLSPSLALNYREQNIEQTFERTL